ncbi:tol-pal system-associated acyl-CoA thioesterase [Caldimonas sp. KR1-144]|uniref:tol-pal system-associated acyl-CoA thioesterase n=1 Tax=Caldimonas sp. KR1-144 TaxID=3400911 RepID=UPI003C0A23BA
MTVSNSSSENFRFALRVYWEDTDAGGVVFYANYLKFFERARTEWLRALGFSQEPMRSVERAMFVVSETAVRYLQPARLDDWLEITVRLVEQGRASLAVAQQAWRAGPGTAPQLLAEGTIRIGCVDVQTFKPRRIPAGILERLGA